MVSGMISNTGVFQGIFLHKALYSLLVVQPFKAYDIFN